MNRLVAERASLIFSRLVVSRACGALEGGCVTLQAQQIHLTHIQQPRICGAMGCMATGAALRLDRHVFVHEWPPFVCVTFETDSVALGYGANLAQRRRAMHVVTVTAPNESLINAMMVWFRKVSFLGNVASEAKSRLCVNEQVLGFLRVVGGMAG